MELLAATLRQVTEKLDDPGRVASIAVASMGEAAVPLDSSGEPTHDIIIAWFDARAGPQAEQLGRVVGQDYLFGLTGLSLQPIFGLCKLLLKENEPDLLAHRHLAERGRLHGVPSVRRRRHGLLPGLTHLALDLHGLRWAELLEGWALPGSRPPRGGGSFLVP